MAHPQEPAVPYLISRLKQEAYHNSRVSPRHFGQKFRLVEGVRLYDSKSPSHRMRFAVCAINICNSLLAQLARLLVGAFVTFIVRCQHAAGPFFHMLA